ncbi:hypothetical protein AEAC466_18515 [Asticcacaulis sp. AC466]|uniref:hypothetical protein n=1 Tax=Asticcacaulis sp. AC466 TaxID=1282362 RepID=UPI0003C3E80B|nr:hypothetical protein [Asticcacaulis sp. AC466]ESQ82131.1 hypothetical protein AEAC466_18515 [Asticcacaulis sp. AC466]
MNMTTAQTAEHAETEQRTNQPDPFPPEGTDEKTLNTSNGEKPLSDAETLKATRAALDTAPAGPAGNADDATAEDLIDAGETPPDAPDEGARDDAQPSTGSAVPSPHVPDTRTFDL